MNKKEYIDKLEHCCYRDDYINLFSDCLCDLYDKFEKLNKP